MTESTITAAHFTARTGSQPVNDDLERCNCAQAGNIGHSQCGWNNHVDLPVFMVGNVTALSPEMAKAFEQQRAKQAK